MRSRSDYPQSYVEECRASIAAQLATYKALKLSSAPRFERLFFNNLVVVLDRSFVHRTIGDAKAKTATRLNEVRMLCDSILENKGVLAANSGIKYEPAKSGVKLGMGSEIKLTQEDFVRLYEAFFFGNPSQIHLSKLRSRECAPLRP
jgi:hypothetical protein